MLLSTVEAVLCNYSERLKKTRSIYEGTSIPTIYFLMINYNTQGVANENRSSRRLYNSSKGSF